MANGELKIDKFPTVCFAPPLSDGKIADYEIIVSKLKNEDPQLHGAMQSLLDCVKQWWALPDSKRSDGDKFRLKHQGKDITVHFAPLEEDHQKKLFDAIPWDYELDAIQGLFDRIPAENKKVRDCAFHLLWFTRELCRDVEPVTQDKLPA
jgi:hypothetical protein